MKKIKAFTMIEILITALVLGIGILTLHKTITHAKQVNERTFQTMIANQLATEGVEILYQIRNTNFLKYESDKEIYVENCIRNMNLHEGGMLVDRSTYTNDPQCDRINCYDLCLTKFKNEKNIDRCRLALDYEKCIKNSNYTGILSTGFYYITTNNNGGNTIHQCTGDYNNLDNDGCLSNTNECCHRYRNEYSICLNSGVRVPCPTGHEGDESTYGRFYRYIEGMGIYNMEADTTGGDLLSIDELSNKNAQEFRFCSTVARAGGENPAIEICSTMTNFIE